MLVFASRDMPSCRTPSFQTFQAEGGIGCGALRRGVGGGKRALSPSLDMYGEVRLSTDSGLAGQTAMPTWDGHYSLLRHGRLRGASHVSSCAPASNGAAGDYRGG
jgi:hypothetical protein